MPALAAVHHPDEPATDQQLTPEERCHYTSHSSKQVLSNIHGADIHLYLGQIRQAVYSSWKPLMPKVVEKPFLKQGLVSVCFAVLPDGKLEPHGMVLMDRSVDTSLDRAAWGAIQTAIFPRFPEELHEPRLVLQFQFRYNMDNRRNPTSNLPAPPTLPGDVGLTVGYRSKL